MKPGVSFFCPAYNDEGNIRRTVECALETFRKLSLDHEIVIVEDGSPDETAAVADQLAEEFDSVRVIHHEKNRGYGGALMSGFNEARNFELVTYTDGDGQFNFSEFEELLNAWQDGYCVIGYRINRAEGFRRDVQNRIYSILLRIMFGLKVRDVNCSMKLYQRKHLDGIEIKSNSSFLDAEILIKLRRLGVNVREVAVHHYPRLHGEASGTKLSVVTDTISDMFSYWRRKS
jgi:glycosyltransferase involved in cell wall biosynthesis